MKKVALVTGAAGNGVGRSTVLTLAKEGYAVVVNYRTSQQEAEYICKYIINNGGEAVPIKANVFDKVDCQCLINETLDKYKKIDACVIGPGAGWNPESPEELNADNSLDDVLNEVKPIYYLCPQIIKEMKKNGGGSIVGIATNPRMPSPSYSYNVAKNARIDALLEMVNICWNNRIRVNVVAPGPVEHFINESAAISALSNNIETVAITPQDIADSIAFLCSDKGRYITGNVLKFNF